MVAGHLGMERGGEQVALPHRHRMLATQGTDGREHLDLASFRFSRTPYAVDADITGGVDEGGWP